MASWPTRRVGGARGPVAEQGRGRGRRGVGPRYKSRCARLLRSVRPLKFFSARAKNESAWPRRRASEAT